MCFYVQIIDSELFTLRLFKEFTYVQNLNNGYNNVNNIKCMLLWASL